MQNGRTTALEKFARLETIGLWRPAPDAQRREVVVSFGEATVVIAEGSGRPLTHWSLPAVERLNPGQMPALYAPDGDPAETLELDDPMMIEALEKVRGAIAAARPRPGFLRRRGTWTAAAAIVGLSLFWAPGALKRQTLSLVPEATRQEIGATLLGLVQRETGPACRAEGGVAALDRLADRLFGAEAGVALVVLPGDLPGPVRLPGRIVVLPRATIAATDDPLVFAGDILAAWAAGAGEDPLAPVLDTAGLRATLTLLATGTLPAAPLEPLAARLLTVRPAPAAPGRLAEIFAQANVTAAPWAAARNGGIPPGAGGQPATTPVMSDADWVSLQAICAG